MRTLVLIFVLSWLTACGGEPTAEDYLERAREYMQAGDFASASVELQNALKQDASLAEASWLLGRIFYESGQPAPAIHEFQRAGELGWDPNEVQPALAQALLNNGDFDEVLAMETTGLEPAGAVALLSTQAVAALAGPGEDRSDELIAEAVKLAPESVEIYIARATLFLATEKYRRALAQANKATEISPENPRAWRVKAQALIRLERLEEAREALDKSISLTTVAFADRIARALIALEYEDYDAAQADAAVLHALAPENPATHYVVGLLSYQNRDYLSTIENLNLAEPVAYQYPLVNYYLAVAYQFENDLDLSASYARRFVNAAPTHVPGRKLRAITLIQAGLPDKAQQELISVLDVTPDDPEALNIMANALLLDDQAYAGLMAYTRLLDFDPEWEVIPLGKESLLLTEAGTEKGGPMKGVSGIETSNFPQPEILKIREHLANEDYPAAIEVAKSYQFRDIESLSPYHVLGKIYLAAGQEEDARQAFEKALKRDPGDTFSIMNLAQIKLDHDDPAAAREDYQKILESDPGNLAVLLQLAKLEAKDGNTVEVVRLLELAVKAHPEALQPRLNLAGYHMSQGEPERVPAVFSNMDELQRKSPQALEAIGLAFMGSEQYDEAVLEFEQLVDAQPESPESYYLLAMATNAAGDRERSKASLQQGLKIDGDHVPTLLSLARIAQVEGDAQAADGYLEKLNELDPDSLDVLQLHARAAQARGDTGAAAAYASRGFELAPSSVIAIELAAYQWDNGEQEKARAHLEKWIAENPQDVAARLALAGWLQNDIDIPAAVAQYEAIVNLQPANVVALNNLAWCLKDSDLKRAQEYIERAARMIPDNPAILDTLAVIQHMAGDNSLALRNVTRALESAPGEPSLRYHEAMIRAALGEKGKALEILNEITAEDSSEFPYREDALALMQELKG